MATDTAQAHNGAVNGEIETKPKFAPLEKEPHSSQPLGRPDPEHTDPDTAMDARSPQEQQGTVENAQARSLIPKSTPEHEEQSMPAKKEGRGNDLPDYEYYEALGQNDGADSTVPAVTEGGREPAQGTPVNGDEPAPEDKADKMPPRLENSASEDEKTRSNEKPQGSEPAHEEGNRDVDETSEGMGGTVPAKAEEISGTDSDSNKDGTGERPVRQQLKKTSIAEGARPVSPLVPTKLTKDQSMAIESARASSTGNTSQASSADGRGRVRKRSLDDVDGDEETGLVDEDDNGHRRKRSRESKDDRKSADRGEFLEGAAKNANAETGPEENSSPEDKTDELEKLRSPKKKRSREQLEDDKLAEKIESEASAEGERETKRHRDNSQERSKEDAEAAKVGTNPCFICDCSNYCRCSHLSPTHSPTRLPRLLLHPSPRRSRAKTPRKKSPRKANPYHPPPHSPRRVWPLLQARINRPLVQLAPEDLSSNLPLRRQHQPIQKATVLAPACLQNLPLELLLRLHPLSARLEVGSVEVRLAVRLGGLRSNQPAD